MGLFLRCGFTRFQTVKLFYNYSNDQTIYKKCHLFVKHLKTLSTGLNDSTIIQFYAAIYEDADHIDDVGHFGCHIKDDQSNFGCPMQLLNHVRNELLPICAAARCYKFSIRFLSHTSATNILDSILQIPAIISSTNVEFNFFLPYGVFLKQLLPVDAISAWLNRNSDGIIIRGQKQQKNPLELTVHMNGVQVQNAHELLEHVKKVHFANFKLYN